MRVYLASPGAEALEAKLENVVVPKVSATLPEVTAAGPAALESVSRALEARLARLMAERPTRAAETAPMRRVWPEGRCMKSSRAGSGQIVQAGVVRRAR